MAYSHLVVCTSQINKKRRAGSVDSPSWGPWSRLALLPPQLVRGVQLRRRCPADRHSSFTLRSPGLKSFSGQPRVSAGL